MRLPTPGTFTRSGGLFMSPRSHPRPFKRPHVARLNASNKSSLTSPGGLDVDSWMQTGCTLILDQLITEGRLKIGFAPGAPWGAISQLDCRAKSRNPLIKPLALRVYFAALGWGNQVGHAEFAEGALASILAGESGQVLTRQAVNKGVAAAKCMGLIGPESGARCLVLPSHHFQKSGLGSASCRVHSLRTAA